MTAAEIPATTNVRTRRIKDALHAQGVSPWVGGRPLPRHRAGEPDMSTSAKTRTITRRAFTDALEASGFYDFEIRDSYCGRGMHGETCFGIVVNRSDERRAFVALGWACGYAEASDYDDLDVWEGLIRAASTDSMGRDVIVYFPRWTLAEDEHRGQSWGEVNGSDYF